MNSRSPSDAPTNTGTFSSCAAPKTAFNKTESATLKWPSATSFFSVCSKTSRKSCMWPSFPWHHRADERIALGRQGGNCKTLLGKAFRFRRWADSRNQSLLRMIAARGRRRASLHVPAAEEVLKAWVGARRVEVGVHLHPSQPDFAPLARLHEMREGPIHVV